MITKGVLLVMLWLQPKALSWAKLAVKKPSQARPFSRLQMAFGPAQGFIKPEPGALAAAFYIINLVLLALFFLEFLVDFLQDFGPTTFELSLKLY